MLLCASGTGIAADTGYGDTADLFLRFTYVFYAAPSITLHLHAMLTRP